jgi:large subunit ribosomal protein L28
MKKCEISGKGKQYGNNVSFSQRHTKKVWEPNLQKKTLIIDGKKIRVKISTSALRTLKRKGIVTPPTAKAK